MGVPTNQALCEGLRALAGDDVTAHWHTTVTGLDRDASGKTWSVSGVNKRRLDEGQAGSKEKRLSGRNAAVVVCDVMAARKGTPGTCAVTGLPDSGDAANAWAAFANPKVPERVGLFSCMLAFDAAAPKPEFDAAVVTGSDVINLLVRDSSKPGRWCGRTGWSGGGDHHDQVRRGDHRVRAAHRRRRVQSPDGRVLREDRAGDRGEARRSSGWLAATTTASTRPRTRQVSAVGRRVPLGAIGGRSTRRAACVFRHGRRVRDGWGLHPGARGGGGVVERGGGGTGDGAKAEG